MKAENNKEELFLDYKSFWNTAGEKRSRSKALDDINMLEFDKITYNSVSQVYTVDVRMKDEYHDGYMINKYLVENNLVLMENIHLIHWAEWLNIGIMTKLYPDLMKYWFLVTRVEIALKEPTFIDQPIIYKMSILCENHKEKKHEFTFFNKVGYWVYILVDYVIVKDQLEIMEHYHEKHQVIKFNL